MVETALIMFMHIRSHEQPKNNNINDLYLLQAPAQNAGVFIRSDIKLLPHPFIHNCESFRI